MGSPRRRALSCRRFTAALVVSALLVSGCWSRREINDLGVVMGLGVDLAEDGKVEVTLALALPAAAGSGKGQQGGGGRPNVILRRTGSTLTEAIRKAELSSPRRLTLQHSRVILLGERLVEQGIDTLLDFLLRSPQVRLSSHVLVVKGVSILHLFEVTPLTESLQSQALAKMASTHAGLTVKLKDFFIARASGYQAVMLPVVEAHPHPGNEENAPELEPALAGAALFHGDRVHTYVNEQEVRGAMWLRNQARDAVVTVQCPDQPDRYISARVSHASHKIQPVWDGHQLSFNVLVKGQVHVSDVQCPVDLSDIPTLNRINSLVEDRVKERVKDVIRTSQSVPADPFEFGEQVRAKLPRLWRSVGTNWSQAWGDARVNISAKVRIVHIEMTTSPPSVRAPGR